MGICWTVREAALEIGEVLRPDDPAIELVGTRWLRCPAGSTVTRLGCQESSRLEVVYTSLDRDYIPLPCLRPTRARRIAGEDLQSRRGCRPCRDGLPAGEGEQVGPHRCPHLVAASIRPVNVRGDHEHAVRGLPSPDGARRRKHPGRCGGGRIGRHGVIDAQGRQMSWLCTRMSIKGSRSVMKATRRREPTKPRRVATISW
jgi:hypothetical protein